MGSSRSDPNSGSKKKTKPLLDSNKENGKPAPVKNWLVHLLFCLLPLLGGGVILYAFYEILDQSEATIQDLTVSKALAVYEPYNKSVFLMILGASFMFIVTMARGIQIKTYFTKRCPTGSYGWSSSCLNYIAALFNILAYVGLIVLAIFKTTDDPEQRSVHFYGAALFFICSNIYGVLHNILLWKQTQYPFVMKAWFIVVAICSIVLILLFAFTRETKYEWAAAVAAPLYVMFFTILFLIDPVDDELSAFFFGFCCKRKS